MIDRPAPFVQPLGTTAMAQDQKRKSRLVPGLFGTAVGALLRYDGLEYFRFWPA